MGSYSTNIDLGIPTDSRENMIQYYEFIDVWTDSLGLDNKKIEVEFQYAIGKITCVSDSFEEFKAESVGQQTDFVHITIHIFDGDIKLYYISVHNRYESSPENVYISCDSRQMLSNLLDSLEQTNEKYFSQDNEQQIIEQHFHGNQISITDSQVTNSNIGGESNTINVNDNKKEKTTQRTIAETIIANITSNIIWWILGAIAVVVLAYWGIGGE